MRRSHYEPLDKNEVSKRRLRILSALFKALEDRGYSLIVDRYNKHDVQVELNAERIELLLSERIRQYRRYLTEDEKRERGDLSTGRKWTQEREPTGDLILKAKEARGYGWTGEWRDAPNRPMEDQINQILGAIAGGFEEIRLRREREAVTTKRRWKMEQERQRQEMERKREVLRCRGLVNKAEAWRTAAEIRAFVEAVRTRFAGNDEPDETASFETWNGWALDQANRIDPLQADDLFDLDVRESEVWALRD